MYKCYEEHPNFGEYIAYDLAMGKTLPMTKEEFDSFEDLDLKFSNPTPSPLRTRFPRRAYFQITRNCQLSCDYCYVKAGPKQPHLEKSVVLNLVDYLGKYGLMEVRLTGGEPTTHPNFIEICEHFFKNNIYISVGTNGLWTNPIKEFIAAQRYFCLAVTIDGTELTHSAYRQHTHTSLLKNLEELRKKNPYIRIRINMVVTKSNQDHYPDLVHFAKDIAAESLTFLPLRPRLDNPALSSEVLSADEFRDLASNATSCHLPDKEYEDANQRADYKSSEAFSLFKKRKICFAGRERLNISFNAIKRRLATFACSFSPAMEETIEQKIREQFIAGEFDYENIDQLYSIWADDSRWEIFRDRDLKPQACSSCPSLGKSCGGAGYCHIQNHKYRQLKLDVDIKQQLRKQMVTLPVWCEYTKSNSLPPENITGEPQYSTG